MSNPLPFGDGIPLPLDNDEDEFCFQVEAQTTYPIQNHPFIDNPHDLASSSSLPISEYDDLSMFLDDHDQQDFPFIGQLYETQDANANININTNWVPQHDMVMTTTTTTTTTTMIDDQDGNVEHGNAGFEVGQGGSSTKKLKHNAKERVRRMNLNATYLSLRSLLPESRRAKKRWSAPYVIDRALDYIPLLQSEIDKLTLKKDNMLSVIGKDEQVPLVAGASTNTDHDQHVLLNTEVHNSAATLTVSMNEVKDGEVIIQICEDKDKANVLTTLLDIFEAEGTQILGASALWASEDRSCFHIHIQMNEKPRESDYVANLHQKIISWLS